MEIYALCPAWAERMQFGYSGYSGAYRIPRPTVMNHSIDKSQTRIQRKFASPSFGSLAQQIATMTLAPAAIAPMILAFSMASGFALAQISKQLKFLTTQVPFIV